MEISGTFPAAAIEFDTDEGPSYAQFGEASTGTKQILMRFQILSGEYAGVTVPYIGYFTKETVDGTLKALRTAGMKGEDLNTLYGDDRQQLNQRVDIVVEMKANQNGDKSYPQVRWVNAPGGGGFKLKAPLAKTDRLKFAAQLKAKLKSIPEVHGEVATDTPTPPPDVANDGGPGGPNDGLPF